MSVLCLGFPYKEACLLEAGGSQGVWSLSKPSSLGGGLQPKFAGDTAWRMKVFGILVFSWFSCHACECGFSSAGLVSAGLFLCLFVGVMAFCWWGSSTVLYGVSWGLHSFVRGGGCVGFVCCAGILISILSSF